MKVRKLRYVIAAILLVFVVLFSGCEKIVEETEQQLSVYVSFYPIYALTSMVTRNIPNLELHCLVEPQNGCLRDYQISDRDLYLLGYSADALVLAGSGLESFADALTGESNTQIAVLSLLEGLELLQGSSNEEDSHFDGANPYLYMSIDGAIAMINNASAGFSVLDPEYENLYVENSEAAVRELTKLQSELLAEAFDAKGLRAAVLAEPMFYVAEMYEMETVCTVERECGQILYDSEIEDCLNALKNADVEIVLIEQQAPKKLKNAIREAGYPLAEIDCMTTGVESEGADGYVAAQKSNAKAIANAVKGE